LNNDGTRGKYAFASQYLYSYSPDDIHNKLKYYWTITFQIDFDFGFESYNLEIFSKNIDNKTSRATETFGNKIALSFMRIFGFPTDISGSGSDHVDYIWNKIGAYSDQFKDVDSITISVDSLSSQMEYGPYCKIELNYKYPKYSQAPDTAEREKRMAQYGNERKK
jgi:hypothetical protein